MKLKLQFAIALITMFLDFSVYAQTQNSTPPQIKEYATVYMKVYYQGNQVVYDPNGLSKSPVITMPDGRNALLYDQTKLIAKNDKGELQDVGRVLNYMASFGWTLVTSNTLSYEAGGQKDGGALLNTNQYFQFLAFERNIVQK